jgi:hypothetical protein
VREYLPLLLGLFSGCASGMEVLKSASLLPQLLVLSSRAELDYLSRYAHLYEVPGTSNVHIFIHTIRRGVLTAGPPAMLGGNPGPCW